MTPARSWRAALLILLALAVSMAVSGCGKKGWPEPSDSEHVITIAEVSGTLNNGCLFVDATLGGAWKNVEAVYLKYGPADCPECPFTPTASIEFIPGQGNTMLAKGRLSLQACGLDAPEGYRWQIEVANRHAILRPVASEVMNTF
ncbi:hypothetical protein [Desulfovibrio ferrophilus]|uniref:Putative lipoprotein n=1 Tax=Desulfovibrio ferrophilus TaxID=241368 RepID=A0A2Z6AWP8_9BACT|nr:hypothetical protein [Desulfovibrio ferrophilus]BBD07677.1 putative lipoprotein [Desulfovibrio ferrophilus]